MTADQETLLSLQNLVILRRGLDLAGTPAEELSELDRRIDKFRRKLPGRVVSAFDRAAQQHSNAVTVVADGECQGCHERVSRQALAQVTRPNGAAQCDHCGRLLVEERGAPDYVA